MLPCIDYYLILRVTVKQVKQIDGCPMQERFIFLPAIVIFLFGLHLSFAQQPSRSDVFDRYDRLIEDLQHKNASLFSPQNYEKALKLYKKASKEYGEENPDLEKIKKTLRECESYCLDALKNVEIARSMLSKTITKREAALDAGAPQFATERWEKAEEKFKDACEELEDDDREDAVKKSSKAATYYYQARIEALKNNVLQEARSNIELAKKLDAPKWCPMTYHDAESIIKDTELLIEQNPDDLKSIRQNGEKAAYLGRHAIFLAKLIAGMHKKVENPELLILKFEDLLSTIGEPFKYHPTFDQGFDPVVETILAYIANLKSEQKRLFAENDSLKNELTTLKEKEMGVSKALQKKQELEEKIAKVKSLFKADEAEVRVQDNNLLIRLSGLKFRPGKAIIQPEYFSLLTKVQRAIMEFPKSYIVVQGHTDATGNAYKNKLLSEKRALAVKEYLNANINFDPNQIQAIGMGDQKPIASNKTAEGRAKNRRIDIFIALPK